MKISKKLQKCKNKIKQAEWKRANKYYTSIYTKNIERIRTYLLFKERANMAAQKRIFDIKIKEKNDEIVNLENRLLALKQKYDKYFALKTELEKIKDYFEPALTHFEINILNILKIFKQHFDKFDYIEHQHEKLKKGEVKYEKRNN